MAFDKEELQQLKDLFDQQALSVTSKMDLKVFFEKEFKPIRDDLKEIGHRLDQLLRIKLERRIAHHRALVD